MLTMMVSEREAYRLKFVYLCQLAGEASGVALQRQRSDYTN